MSQAEVLYQSVLRKLGQISPEKLEVIDHFLEALVKNEAQKKNEAKKVVMSLGGAWKDWDEKTFDRFLDHAQEVREELFSDRFARI